MRAVPAKGKRRLSPPAHPLPRRATASRGLAALALLLAGCHPEPAPGDVATCETAEYPPRQLRLLARREYDATIRDLLPFLASTCDTDPDCSLTDQSCVSGTCAADPCELVTFVLPASDGPYGSVTVAGSFNGWASSAEAGGWPMTWDAERQLYWAKASVLDGSWQYKFVIDGSTWLSDPANPQTTPDGYGGDNSVLIQACAGAAPVESEGYSVSEDFPAESRPSGYFYDNNAAAGLVTSVHVEQYLRAGERIAAGALEHRDELLGCDPAASGCLAAWVDRFGARAWRRPLTAEESARILALAEGQTDPDTGVSVALQVLLSSPAFLYRSELGTEDGEGSWRLDAYETASAMSYLYWGSMPDEALFAAAASGALSSEAGIATEARRMLADPRARDQIGTFAVQWLGVESVETLDREPAYTLFTDAARAGMLAETAMFVGDAALSGPGGFESLYTADHTFVNDAVAAIYGYPLPGSTELVRVQHTGQRVGLLGQASLLTATAHSDQTSPIRRGVLVRTRLLCQDLPPPDPAAGGVPEVDPTATTRERYAQHTSDPACASCHQYIDDVGFGFEHFDPIGAWRDTDNGQPVDASGNMNDVEALGDGTDAPFDSMATLGQTLAASDAARQCVATQIYRFAIGGFAPTGDCSLTTLDDALLAADGDLAELLIGVATAPGFVRRSDP